MSDDQKTEVSATLPGGSFKIAGARIEVIATVTTLVLCVLIGYVLWEHKGQAAASQLRLESTLEKAFDKVADTNVEMTRAQREMNCVIAYRRDANQTPEQLLDFCKRFAR